MELDAGFFVETTPKTKVWELDLWILGVVSPRPFIYPPQDKDANKIIWNLHDFYLED